MKISEKLKISEKSEKIAENYENFRKNCENNRKKCENIRKISGETVKKTTKNVRKPKLCKIFTLYNSPNCEKCRPKTKTQICENNRKTCENKRKTCVNQNNRKVTALSLQSRRSKRRTSLKS